MQKSLQIVGCPKSGTAELHELVAAGFDISESLFESSNVKPFYFHSGAVLSKHPTDILEVQPLLEADDSLYVINIIRDPRAVIASQRGSMKDYFSSYRLWKQRESISFQLLTHPRFLQVHYEELIADPDHVQLQIMRQFPFMVFKKQFSLLSKHIMSGQKVRGALDSLKAVVGRFR